MSILGGFEDIYVWKFSKCQLWFMIEDNVMDLCEIHITQCWQIIAKLIGIS